ncbi:MAG: hypothetical protein V1754_06005 [Pseudomonadota bacterium]
MNIPTRILALLLVATSTQMVACPGMSNGQKGEPPAGVVIESFLPTIVLPGTIVQVKGRNLSNQANHILWLDGSVVQGESSSGVPNQTALFQIPLTIEETNTHWVADQRVFIHLGNQGTFSGKAWVESQNDWGKTNGSSTQITFKFAHYLKPTLAEVGNGIVYLNSEIVVQGENMLLGGAEGSTIAELTGCFLQTGEQGTCVESGTPVDVKLEVSPDSFGDRGRGVFLFEPTIGGILPGHFEGQVKLTNLHPDAQQISSANLSAIFDLGKSRVTGFKQSGVSLGQYLDIEGNGFVGNSKGEMIIRFEGTFDGFIREGKRTSENVAFELIPKFVSGEQGRYVLDDIDGIAKEIDTRTEYGMLSGKWTPTIFWQGAQIEGDSITANLDVKPVKQVVWVRYTGGWYDSLRMFGLQAGDVKIQQRVKEVFEYVYWAVNAEFRNDEPKDFEWYAIVDIAGPDPNRAGLFGYDNTAGKDIGNMRLYDRVGGVNAITQEDGYAGYGGIFVENFMAFSMHPPPGLWKKLGEPLFDEIFDPFRPDTGQELTSSEVIAISDLTNTQFCPAKDRLTQAACAIRAMGNMVGHTAAHEFAHSLGLSKPCTSSLEQSHLDGDLPNRLMEGGEGRPFAERAELSGQGPAIFCGYEFEYLQMILPTGETDPLPYRPDCGWTPYCF